ncbi:uncharacterized protein LOC100208285 isoform X1 [Hydra vulgaris]|uniref:uncharacterized protein LOC100208285 isoform X1 n=1 Tax=Hydra vulgaris TaxID=6087 RepID=UPI001F5ED1EF|nr:uncharacterized protein LOC100208285 isoform X2 [Hydra vulgaris]
MVFYMLLLFHVLWMVACNTNVKGYVDSKQNNEFYAANYKCPNGWQQRCEKCYLYVNESKQWTDAQYYCKQNGGNLVTIKEDAVNLFLARYVQYSSRLAITIWTGLHARKVHKEFQWVDNSESVHYEFRWLPGQPNMVTLDEGCVEMYTKSRQYLWDDVSCSKESPFVCQTDGCIIGTQRCDNGKCVSKHLFCDSKNDCGDFSDEKNCTKCNEHYTAQEGSISSPNFPQHYGNNRDCTWLIEVERSYIIEIKFLEFFIENSFDWVEVFDGPTLASKSFGKFSGNFKPEVILSSSSKILVHLKSDKSTSDKGFFARYKAVKKGCNVDLIINSNKPEYISSPNFPLNYPDNTKCEWTIRNEDPSKILTFQLLELETEENDFIEVRDGLTEDNALLGKFFGNFSNIQKRHIFTSNFKMHVKFQSNFQLNQKGFRAVIFSGCTATINATHGTISSPNFGVGNYPNNILCSWTVHAQTDKEVSVIFHSFDTEYKQDTVVLRTCDDVMIKECYGSNKTTLGKEMLPLEPIVFNSSCFKVIFKSDETYSLEGFNATFSIGCPMLPAINGGSFRQDQKFYGASVEYKCDSRFRIKSENGNVRKCMYGGNWSEPAPFCEEINCGHPGIIENGGFEIYPLNSTFVFMTSVKYSCNVGYILVGEPNRVCQVNSTWSGGVERKCEVLKCPDPGTPVNGTRSGNEFNVGSSITFSCEKGFRRHGARTITCGITGKWSSETPLCKVVVCQLPSFSLNTIISSSSIGFNTPYKTVLHISCKKGFELIGSVNITCTESGAWKPDVPQCIDINECLNNPCRGPGSQCTNLMGSYKCTCKSGFRQIDETTCEDIDECKSSGKTVKCNQKCTNIDGGYFCSCEDGYFLYDGDNKTVNRVEAEESFVNHTCLGNPCKLPKIPENGYILNYGNRYPTEITFQCDKGWIVDGDLSIKCLKNGSWSGSISDCIAARCNPLPDVPNSSSVVDGGLVKGQYSQGTIYTYTCINGYEIISGNSKRMCSQNATASFWSGSSPVCERVSCGPLENPKNGHVNITGDKYGDSSKFFCDGGYIITGNDSSTCQANGRWSASSPFCLASPCPDPGIPINGEIIGLISLDQTITFRCLVNGSILIGDNKRTCIFNKSTGLNQWNGSQPFCKDTSIPTFKFCPMSTIEFTLPQSEKSMMVNWTLPTLTDNVHNLLNITVSPDYVSPMVMPAGLNIITYTATYKDGSTAVCEVKINVQDKEIPKIFCPKNIVIKSDLSSKVFWSDGIYTDNVGIKNVIFNPPNGTILESNKYHKVTMTVEDISGNSDSCVMEIYVEGCGCTQRTCDYKQRNGQSVCTIAPGVVPDTVIISCNLNCFQNKTTRFVSNTEFEKTSNVMCIPNKGWENKSPSGCVERKPLISCLKGSLSIDFTTTGDNTNEKPFLDIFTFLNNLKNSTCSFIYQTGNLISNGTSVAGDFKILSHDDGVIPLLNGHLEECKTILLKDLDLFKTNLLQLTSSVDIKLLNISSCCPLNKSYCCPTGHLIKTTGLTVKASYCIPCGLGMYHNSTNNKCLNCPVGFYNDLEFADQCKRCPNETNNLKVQSDSCTKMCAAGSYSSTGLEPTCRKCDYGEYQSQVGAYNCIKCPYNLTTSRSGSENISECKAQCSPGTYSSTGLEPCTKCAKGLFQNEIGRSYCKLCPSGGIYLGMEGATSEANCPSKNACDEKPCRNGATCNAGNYSYTCTCKPGWTGVNCEVDIDECASSPCGRHGTCTNLINDFNCTCIKGIIGKQCETNIDDCKNDTCRNGGICNDLVDDFKCLCAAGFEGKRCEINKNECEPNPCLKNSTCEDLINDFKCNCIPGYVGKLCDVDIDECAMSPCFNNATCVDKVNAFECKCQPGFNGTLCETDIDECSTQPCANNGSCIDIVNGFLCRCIDGFRGSNCSINIDECDPSPCLHNSTCVDQINGFQCECSPGYFGLRCETEINECESQPCSNNATCVDKINDYQCLCNIGFEGKQCEIDINECQPNPCVNGSCKDLVGDYLCECQPGFDGRNCSNLIDNCFSLPCKNNGNCTNKVNNYTCTCQAGFSGSDCETNINECDPDPCNSNALNCTDLINGYICYCKLGFRGENCSEIIDNCNPQPCRHNSTCTNRFVTNDFHCNCSLGYEGDRCEIEIDECKALPCKNGGNCTDLPGKYLCTCPPGFTGVDCEINIDDCKNVSCLNGGKCIDLINSYVCECPVTHKGKHCEKKIPDDVDITFPGGDGSYIKHCVKGNASKEFSISLWFRFLGRSRGVFLNLGFGCETVRPFLIMSHSSIRFQFRNQFSFVMIDNLKINNEKLVINNGVWHHIYIALSSVTLNFKVVLDGIIVQEEQKAELSGMTFFNESGTILIGKSLLDGKLIESGFIGDVSQVALFKRVLDSTEIAGLVRNCSRNISDSIIPWVGLMADAGPNVSLLETWTCGTNVCPPEFTGKFCQTKIDKIPPTVVFCPSPIKVYTEESSVFVTWKEPQFDDDVAVVEVIRSHSPNGLFSWGDYVITYIAKDAFENSVSCTFEINVTPFNCSEFQTANNSIHACGTWKYGRFCDYKCHEKYELAVPKPPFYVCGRPGTWSHGPPTYPENPDLLVSECTATTPFNTITTNKISFPTSSCDDSFKNDFVESFKQLITELQDVWSICGTTCDFKNIKVSCKPDAKRFRRDMDPKWTGPKFILDISFDATNETNLAKIQNGIKTKEFNMTVIVNNVSISSDLLNVEVKTVCNNGSILKNDICVKCPAGTFKNVTNELCEKCPFGSYSKEAGSEMCINCPANTTTTSEGSTEEKSCKVKCLFGAYLENNECKDCPIGFYKETAGFEKCQPCALGLTTKKTGAVTKDQCKNDCTLGQELVNNTCQPCRMGYYRNNDSQPVCLPCPYNQSTYQLGATSPVCYAVCEVGKEISSDGLKCMECAIGYYKNDNNAKTCSKCPAGLTTKQLASTSIDQCIEKSSDSKYYDVQVAITSLTWSDNLYNQNSVEYRDVAYKIIESVYGVYLNMSYLLFVNITKLSSGSVVANLTLGFNSSVKDPLFAFDSAVKSQQFYKLTVDPDSLIADRCKHIVCPMEQVCSYDTRVECKCTVGKQKSPDGEKCYDTCELKGCPEGQECFSNSTFNECRCKDGKVLSSDKKECIYTCELKGCPEGQECFSNSTFNECRCKDGKVLSPDKKRCINQCSLHYCKNGGSCQLKETGPVCRCSKNYSGDQCQTLQTKSNALMIVLVSLSTVAVVLIVIYVLKNRKKRIYNECRNDLMYDDEKSLELSVKNSNLDKKSVTLTRYDHLRSSEKLGRINGGATFDDNSPAPLIRNSDQKR